MAWHRRGSSGDAHGGTRDVCVPGHLDPATALVTVPLAVRDRLVLEADLPGLGLAADPVAVVVEAVGVGAQDLTGPST